MLFFDWEKLIFNSSSHSNNQDHKVDISKSSFAGMDIVESLHKKRCLHNHSSVNHYKSSGLLRSPLNPMNSQYNSNTSWKNW